jgi:hypothetical protein
MKILLGDFNAKVGKKDIFKNNKQTNSMVLVRERTIPIERLPLVGEVIANFCG